MMNSEAFAVAYELGFSRTVRFLVSRGAPKDVAKDAAQAGWARGWEHIYQLRDDSILLTWINSIALNYYRRSLRKERVLEPLKDMPSARGTDSLSVIDAERALSCCRPQERALLEQYMRGFTAEDIARRLGVTNNAVRIRLLRVRKSVRRHLEEHAQRMHEPAAA